MTRFIAFSASADEFDGEWHVLDTQEGVVGLYYAGKRGTERAADNLNTGISDPESWTWTPLNSLADDVRQAAQSMFFPQASPEFWKAAQSVAEAAGYCEVFDRIATVLGGPVREGREVGDDYFEISVTVRAAGDTYSAENVTQAVREGLNTLRSLRHVTGINVTRTQDPQVVALRERTRELIAERRAVETETVETETAE